MRPLIYILAGALAAVLVLTVIRKRGPEPVWEKLPGTPPGLSTATAATLPKLWQLPEFSLTERSGQPLKLADLQGKVWVADFFYTTCPGPCPMMTSRFSSLHRDLAQEPEVRFVSISTDPEKDTPEMLRAYAERFQADDRWLFLTGEKAEIYQLAIAGFKLSLAETPGAPEPITHSTKLALVDRTGAVRGFYDGLAEDQARIKADILRLLQE